MDAITKVLAVVAFIFAHAILGLVVALAAREIWRWLK